MKTHSTNSKKLIRGSSSRRRTSPERVVTTTAVSVQVTPKISIDFAAAFASSPANALELARAAIVAQKPIVERAVETSELVHWASVSNNPEHRRTVVRAFNKAASPLMLVQHMAELPREQAAVFMKDYLAAGGSLAAVMEWVRIVGGVVRRRRTRTPRARRAAAPRRGVGDLFGNVVDWIVETAENVGEAIVDAVDSLVDAVVSAGKTLAQAVAEAVNWTVEQITDLVEALIRAGKTVAEILGAAVAKGVDLLKKYVEALLEAGRTIGEILIWAAGKAATTVNAVVSKLLQLGHSILNIIKAVIGAGAAAVRAIVTALLAAGKTLANILGAIASEVLSTVQTVIEALLAAGKTIAALLVEAAKLAVAVRIKIVRALLDLGKTLTQLIVAAAGAVGSTLRIILETLLEAGRSLAQILVAIAGEVAVVKAVLTALFALGKTLANVVIAAAQQTVAVARAIFQVLVALGKKVADFLIALAGRAVSALRTALEALLAMGITTLTNLVKDIVTSVAEGFRRGFFEGLVALGKTPLRILQAAAEFSAAVVLLAFAVIIELFGGHRPLSPAERLEAERIFGSSIDLNRVKIANASLPADVINNINDGRPFTTMYIINFASNATVDLPTLIHELTHVWQGVQAGPLYMVRALEAQIGAGLTARFHTGRYNDTEAYTVTNDDLRNNNGNFSRFNPEQQATIVERYWIGRFGTSPGDVTLLEPYARQVFKPITRSTRRVTPSRRLPRSRMKRRVAAK